jgi:hypothetical protein
VEAPTEILKECNDGGVRCWISFLISSHRLSEIGLEHRPAISDIQPSQIFQQQSIPVRIEYRND